MNFNNFMNSYFGPLGKEYCVYFYIWSIFFGILFVSSFISIITFIVMHHKKVDLMFIGNSCIILLNLFIVYLSNRLLHTMCIKSI